MTKFTGFTKMLGDALEKIRNNNMILEQERKANNPTFIEIMERLVKDDKSLAYLLLNWYFDTYCNDSLDISNLAKELIQNTKDIKKKKQYSSSGCGIVISGSCGTLSSISGCGCDCEDFDYGGSC